MDKDINRPTIPLPNMLLGPYIFYSFLGEENGSPPILKKGERGETFICLISTSILMMYHYKCQLTRQIMTVKKVSIQHGWLQW